MISETMCKTGLSSVGSCRVEPEGAMFALNDRGQPGARSSCRAAWGDLPIPDAYSSTAAAPREAAPAFERARRGTGPPGPSLITQLPVGLGAGGCAFAARVTADPAARSRRAHRSSPCSSAFDFVSAPDAALRDRGGRQCQRHDDCRRQKYLSHRDSLPHVVEDWRDRGKASNAEKQVRGERDASGVTEMIPVPLR